MKWKSPFSFLPVIDGNLYGSLQIHESFKGTKKGRAPYITVAIYNPSSEPYYLRKEKLTYNIYVVTPLESKRKILHIPEFDMKVKKSESLENLDKTLKLDLSHLSVAKQSIVKEIFKKKKE